ncbi:MAG: hypothetical protein JWO92_1055 [Chitinophagaceae bacterium]|nr:hypothetical protein [Chitinophagaceae bacterium]
MVQSEDNTIMDILAGKDCWFAWLMHDSYLSDFQKIGRLYFNLSKKACNKVFNATIIKMAIDIRVHKKYSQLDDEFLEKILFADGQKKMIDVKRSRCSLSFEDFIRRRVKQHRL